MADTGLFCRAAASSNKASKKDALTRASCFGVIGPSKGSFIVRKFQIPCEATLLDLIINENREMPKSLFSYPFAKYE